MGRKRGNIRGESGDGVGVGEFERFIKQAYVYTIVITLYGTLLSILSTKPVSKPLSIINKHISHAAGHEAQSSNPNLSYKIQGIMTS